MTNGTDDGVHEEHEEYAWTRRIPDHPPRGTAPPM
jgi:hypothetical protein